jgi:ubiquinone/menaquinone biosynthesis C-methylase UbiE
MEESSQVFKRLFLKVEDIVCCPNCSGELELDLANDCLTCQSDSSHFFPVLEGIPSFVKREEVSAEDAEWVFEYDKKAEEYDEAIRREAKRLGVDLKEEFSTMLERIPVKSSCRVLDVSTGTGAVILRIGEVYPDALCELVGIDLSIGMLRVAQRKFAKAKIEVPLFHSQVRKLPFKNESFDVVTHFGGINTFKDIPAALGEWVRVLKHEGYLLVSDEGVSPALPKTRKGANLIKENWLFGLQPPLEHLPPQVKNVEVRWVVRDMFYAISCQKSSEKDLKELQPLRIWLTASK